MAELFDAYRSTYNDAVQDSIRFSGLKHDFFLKAKVDLLARLVNERGLEENKPIRALDVGCGVGALHPFLKQLLPRLSGCDVSSESIMRAREDNSWVDPPMRVQSSLTRTPASIWHSPSAWSTTCRLPVGRPSSRR